MSTRDETLLAIARHHLRVETLETRKSDSLDFHDCAVWCIRDALEAAYEAGVASATPEGGHGGELVLDKVMPPPGEESRTVGFRREGGADGAAEVELGAIMGPGSGRKIESANLRDHKADLDEALDALAGLRPMAKHDEIGFGSAEDDMVDDFLAGVDAILRKHGRAGGGA